MLYAQVHLTLPVWVHDAVDLGRVYATDAEKLRLAIELSQRNVEAESGGPFGAVVFGPDERIIAIGVNRVLPHACSVAHAEMMAYMLAQGRTQRPRLNRDADDLPIGPITLATSSQPCCQCYGATVWAGIDRLLIGARAEDAIEQSTHGAQADVASVERSQRPAEKLSSLGVGHPLRLHPGR